MNKRSKPQIPLLTLHPSAQTDLGKWDKYTFKSYAIGTKRTKGSLWEELDFAKQKTEEESIIPYNFVIGRFVNHLYEFCVFIKQTNIDLVGTGVLDCPINESTP